jgi:threonine synthase
MYCNAKVTCGVLCRYRILLNGYVLVRNFTVWAFFDTIENLSNEEIAFEAIKQFRMKLLRTKRNCRYTVHLLSRWKRHLFPELFHGPTMAFKDVGVSCHVVWPISIKTKQ